MSDDRFSVDFTGLTLLDQFSVETKLADGGMGSVYRGEDTNLGRKVVVKVPHARFLGEADFRQRFRREITELVRLEHPHIVRILAQGEHDAVPFFVLQFLGGGSLEDRMERPDPAAVASWLPTIAATLDFVHAQGIVHRDVKPANILFDDQGHVFLSDFGVAKALGTEEVNLTADGTGIGSPKYMAPEQMVGDELTPAADQYALGSMVYEAISGRPPFEGKTVVDVLVAKRTADAAALQSVAPGVPRAVSDAVARALSRDPAGRFESCTAFADAVCRPDETPAEGRPASRVPWAAALVVALLALFAYAWFGRDDAAPAAAAGATNDTGRVRLTLLDAGARPRELLRYAVRPGAEELVSVRVDQRMTQAGGRSHPPKRWLLALRVDEIQDNGDLRVSWTTRGFEFEAGTSPGQLESLEERRRSYEAFAGWVVLTENGLTRESALTLPVGTPAGARGDMTNLWWIVRNIAIPYPVEVVGSGATWEVTETLEVIGGMRVTHATTFELVERVGDEVRFELHVAQTAPRQRLGSMFGDLEPTLTALHATGRATSRGDVAHVVPSSFSYAMTIEIEMEFEGAEGTTQSARTEIELEMDASRE